jgi:hypothetical protein
MQAARTSNGRRQFLVFPEAFAVLSPSLMYHLLEIEWDGQMEERDFFNEKDEVVPAKIYCPKCRETLEYPIRWRRRTKKATLPPRADERDRARFAKARNYRVRLDDKLRCKNPRCGKTIEISTLQTVVFD